MQWRKVFFKRFRSYDYRGRQIKKLLSELEAHFL
jgi:hypothetical protein